MDVPIISKLSPTAGLLQLEFTKPQGRDEERFFLEFFENGSHIMDILLGQLVA